MSDGVEGVTGTSIGETKPLMFVRKDDLLTDRSRITQDWKCPRSRYWQYEFEGRGVVGPDLALELFLGQQYHDALARFADAQREDGTLRGEVVDQVSETVVGAVRETITLAGGETPEATHFAAEQAALVEGMLRGMARHIWPRLVAQYPMMRHVEEEMLARRGRVVLMSRPDLVVAESPDDPGWYWEYKGTSSKKKEWVDSWATAVQVHSGIAAVRDTTGVAPRGTIIQGLYKGYQGYGRQQSPFCYGYVKPATPPFQRRETISYEYRAGFQRVEVWQREGGVKAWVEGMPENMLAEQFPQTPPIFLKERVLENFLDQMESREIEIEEGMWELRAHPDQADRILNTYFPQHFDACTPAWGKPCPYKRLCHSSAGEDPRAAGFVSREPHHEAEVERWKEQEVVSE